MKWIMALMALVMCGSLVLAQATSDSSCTDLQDQVRTLSIRLDYLTTLTQNQGTVLNDRITAARQETINNTAMLYTNEDKNALTLQNQIFQKIDDRTDPVKSVIPFMAGFGFCFFLFSAIVIRGNMFLLRKLTLIDPEES